MKIKWKRVLGLGATFVCWLLLPAMSADTTAKRAIIDPAPVLSKKAQSIFDLPIYRSDIRGYRMYDALEKISKEVEVASNGKLRFVFQISWWKPRDYMRKYGGVAAWRIPKPLNPVVQFKGTNIDLRTIIKSLCRQSGWTYDESITPVGYVFTVREKPRPDAEER